jgi:hypothetical protein
MKKKQVPVIVSEEAQHIKLEDSEASSEDEDILVSGNLNHPIDVERSPTPAPMPTVPAAPASLERPITPGQVLRVAGSSPNAPLHGHRELWVDDVSSRLGEGGEEGNEDDASSEVIKEEEDAGVPRARMLMFEGSSIEDLIQLD